MHRALCDNNITILRYSRAYYSQRCGLAGLSRTLNLESFTPKIWPHMNNNLI